jgi:hypothetical protein
MATNPDELTPFDEDPEAAAQAAEQRLIEAGQIVVARLSKLARERVSDRSLIERRWLLDERQYHGCFHDTQEAALANTPEKSAAIINMTRPKTKAWSARLGDLLFPADDKNWGISPTPVPELTESAKEYAAKAQAAHEQAAQMVDIHNRDAQVGTQTMPPGEALKQAGELADQALDFEAKEQEARGEMDVAKRASENMSREIDDQLTECQYPKHSRRAIDDLCKLGSGVMKGPLNGKAAQRWKKVSQIMGGQATDVYKLAPTAEGNRPIALRVDPWAFFPDTNATEMESSESELERHLPNRSQLRRLTKLLDFNKPAVEALLKDGPGHGANSDLDYLAQLRTITNEGSAVTDRYVLWEYHGPLECDEIETIVMMLEGEEAAAKWREDYSELDEVRVIVFFCNDKLLKIEPDWLLDSNETLYSVASFEKSGTSVLGGYGVPAMMRDPERALRAAFRMLLDNGGLSVGPQIVIDKSKVTPEDGQWKMAPRKVWLKSGDDITADVKVFEMFNIPSNTDELVKIIELSLKFIDEMTSLPLIAQGEQGAHITQTAGGMSMLMNSANVIFRDVVKNWDDDMTTPMIRRFYDWNMQFSPKEELKGDMQVEARGTSALLVREIQSANLMLIAQNWSSHPILGKALKVYDALRLAVQSLSINPDDILGTRDEFEQRMKEAAEGQPDDPRIVAAQIDAQSRKEQNAVSLQISHDRLETAIAQVEARTGESREKIAADLKKHADAIQSDERKQAVNIAVEENRAAEARAEGEPAAEATGQGVG